MAKDNINLTGGRSTHLTRPCNPMHLRSRRNTPKRDPIAACGSTKVENFVIGRCESWCECWKAEDSLSTTDMSAVRKYYKITCVLAMLDSEDCLLR